MGTDVVGVIGVVITAIGVGDVTGAVTLVADVVVTELVAVVAPPIVTLVVVAAGALVVVVAAVVVAVATPVPLAVLVVGFVAASTLTELGFGASLRGFDSSAALAPPDAASPVDAEATARSISAWMSCAVTAAGAVRAGVSRNSSRMTWAASVEIPAGGGSGPLSPVMTTRCRRLRMIGVPTASRRRTSMTPFKTVIAE
jgi:hypothetical protein